MDARFGKLLLQIIVTSISVFAIALIIIAADVCHYLDYVDGSAYVDADRYINRFAIAFVIIAAVVQFVVIRYKYQE